MRIEFPPTYRIKMKNIIFHFNFFLTLLFCFPSLIQAALKCFAGSYTVKNWVPCMNLAPGLSLVTPRCTMKSLPECKNNDPLCPEYGVMPCQVKKLERSLVKNILKLNVLFQYSVTKTADAQGNQVVVNGALRDGNSQCPLFEDNLFCNFADKYCTKTVQVPSVLVLPVFESRGTLKSGWCFIIFSRRTICRDQ